MAEFICPKEISDLFETSDEAKLSTARLKATAWVKGQLVNMVPGDKVWMPEIGWFEKEAGGALS